MSNEIKTFKLVNVRLCYPSLFKREKFEGQEKNYAATFLLDKEEHSDVIDQIKKEINSITKENFTVKKQKKYKKKDGSIGVETLEEVQLKHCCFRDGDKSGKELYFDHYTLKATSRNANFKKLHKNFAPASELDNPFYPGCYVTAQISFWYTKKGQGCICANLLGIIFKADGEVISSGVSIDESDLADDDNLYENRYKKDEDCVDGIDSDDGDDVNDGDFCEDEDAPF